MKKLFTLKNCLIILFLLGIATCLMCVAVTYLDNAKMFSDIINNAGSNESSASLQTFINFKNRALTVGITSILSFIFIAIFLVLFISTLLNKFNCVKFSLLSLAFLSFATTMMQVVITYFIQDIYSIAISALIALLISIPCYVYLLLKEIKQRKLAVSSEQVVDTLEPMKNNTTEQK